MAVDVLGTGVFEDWYLELSDSDATSVDRLVSLLEHRGVLLGSPYSSAIKGSRHALRELIEHSLEVAPFVYFMRLILRDRPFC